MAKMETRIPERFTIWVLKNRVYSFRYSTGATKPKNGKIPPALPFLSKKT
jgi:hypothetical protein